MKRRRLLFMNIGRFRLIAGKALITGLFLLAVILLILSRSDVPSARRVRDGVSSVFTPAVAVVQYPVHWVYGIIGSINNLIRVYSENTRLRAQYDKMLELQTRLTTLEVENKELGRLLNYVPPTEARFLTAKIVVQEEDGFSHSVIAYVGQGQEAFAGQPVMGDLGVLGRVESIQRSYARIILLTDINSKIPVMTDNTKIRGILSGDNTLVPKLIFTPAEADLRVGDKLVTSGVAGTFPSGLPVGRISRIRPDQIEVEPIGNIENIEYVRLVDYGVDTLRIENLFAEDR